MPGLFGGIGKDHIRGEDGKDDMIGGDGDDLLVGGAGCGDRADGHEGWDICYADNEFLFSCEEEHNNFC